jgi:hypothetical protein
MFLLPGFLHLSSPLLSSTALIGIRVSSVSSDGCHSLCSLQMDASVIFFGCRAFLDGYRRPHPHSQSTRATTTGTSGRKLYEFDGMVWDTGIKMPTSRHTHSILRTILFVILKKALPLMDPQHTRTLYLYAHRCSHQFDGDWRFNHIIA